MRSGLPSAAVSFDVKDAWVFGLKSLCLGMDGSDLRETKGLFGENQKDCPQHYPQHF